MEVTTLTFLVCSANNYGCIIVTTDVYPIKYMITGMKRMLSTTFDQDLLYESWHFYVACIAVS